MEEYPTSLILEYIQSMADDEIPEVEDDAVNCYSWYESKGQSWRELPSNVFAGINIIENNPLQSRDEDE